MLFLMAPIGLVKCYYGQYAIGWTILMWSHFFKMPLDISPATRSNTDPHETSILKVELRSCCH